MVRLRIAAGLLVNFLLLLFGSVSPTVTDDAGVSSVFLQTTAATPSTNRGQRPLRDKSAQLRIADIPQCREQPRPLVKCPFILPANPQAVRLQVQFPVQEVPSWLWIFTPRVQYLDCYLMQDGQLVRDQHAGES